jgi:hypothetical protein
MLMSFRRCEIASTCEQMAWCLKPLHVHTRKMSYHVLAGANADQVKAACLVKVNNEDGKVYIYWYKDADDAAPGEWVRIQAAFNSH